MPSMMEAHQLAPQDGSPQLCSRAFHLPGALRMGLGWGSQGMWVPVLLVVPINHSQSLQGLGSKFSKGLLAPVCSSLCRAGLAEDGAEGEEGCAHSCASSEGGEGAHRGAVTWRPGVWMPFRAHVAGAM